MRKEEIRAMKAIVGVYLFYFVLVLLIAVPMCIFVGCIKDQKMESRLCIQVDSYPSNWNWMNELKAKAKQNGYDVVKGTMRKNKNKYWCKIKK